MEKWKLVSCRVYRDNEAPPPNEKKAHSPVVNTLQWDATILGLFIMAKEVHPQEP